MVSLDVTGAEAEVVQDIADRQKLGKKKYGVEVSNAGLSHKAWLEHQYQELLDAAIYCKMAINTLPD